MRLGAPRGAQKLARTGGRAPRRSPDCIISRENDMRRAMVTMAVIGLTGGFAGPASAQKGGRGGPNAFGYGWLGSLTEGKAQARKTGKPLMVVIRCVP
jgi:hypothetical protein